MRIFHIASEYAPFAKVGGLGDVVQGLSCQLTKEGHNVEVVLPLYGFISKEGLIQEKPMDCIYDGLKEKIGIFSKKVEGVKILFISHPLFEESKKIYGFPFDTEKFLLFSYFAHSYIKTKNEIIDVVHLHDWHSALFSLFQHFDTHPKLKKIILTLHNPQYQASAFFESFSRINPNLKTYFENFPDLLDEETFQTLNFLKAGLKFSDLVTTVSPTYAKELMQEHPVENLNDLLQTKKSAFLGILNGIDTTHWNPDTDHHLIKNYGKENSLSEVLFAKQINKQFLQHKLKLKKNSQPLVANIGRLADQKGPELILDAIEYTLNKRGQFILLGCPETERIQLLFDEAKIKYKNNPNVAFVFDFDESLARQIYAASDFLIIPSLYEPCGLTQMISLRYGTIPIARKTGGLADTVFDSHAPKENGYLFSNPSSKSLFSCLERAFLDFQQDKDRLYVKICNGMHEDHSWQKSTQNYLRAYGF